MNTAAVMAPRICAYLYALAAAAGLGHFLLGLPIQLTDCYGNMTKLWAPWGELLVSQFWSQAYLRPLLWAELKLVFDASGGDYQRWFRGVHVAQGFALLLLFVHFVRPSTWRDVAVVPLGVAVLIGVHTFRGTVAEAFPVNTFMTVLLCCLAAANLAFARPRWWIDLSAALLFVVAALTVESGLLVGVVLVGAALLGARGVSRPGVAVVAALFVGYFVLRFSVLNVGGPGLIERSSGYGFGILEPEQLIARFGANPLPFYAYNVITSALSVLFSEPRSGVFRLVYGLTLGDPEPSMIVGVVASTCATALLVIFAWRRRASWLSRQFDRDDRIVGLFVIVLAANAAISYPYTKDVIMSPAGVFFAAAVYAAARNLLPAAVGARPLPAAAAAAFCMVLACSWAIRSVSLHLNLREAAPKVRADWAYADDWVTAQYGPITDPRDLALFRMLQRDAIDRRPAPPSLRLAQSRLFEVD